MRDSSMNSGSFTDLEREISFLKNINSSFGSVLDDIVASVLLYSI